jgi:hypothetical protein
MARKDKKQIETNGTGMIPLDEQVTEEGTLPEEVVETQPVEEKMVELKEVKGWRVVALDLLRSGEKIGAVAKRFDVRYQAVRAVAISNNLHESAPRGEKKPAGLKLVVKPEQVERLREVLINACVEDQTLIPVLDQLPAEA